MRISIKIEKVTRGSIFFVFQQDRPGEYYIWKSHIKDWGTIGKLPKAGDEGYIFISDYWYQNLEEHTINNTNIMQHIRGLEILSKYYPDGECHGEHDEITVGPAQAQAEQGDVGAEDQERLGKLGWFFSDQYGGEWKKFN